MKIKQNIPSEEQKERKKLFNLSFIANNKNKLEIGQRSIESKLPNKSQWNQHENYILMEYHRK